jgi:nucleoside-diphosphate-sugar epimerase
MTRPETIEEVVDEYEIDTIYHLAAILSASGEENPQLAWRVNLNGLHTILEIAREHEISRVFWPSSIAVFGPNTPKHDTPQETVLRPTTMYGVTKVAGELLCNYYVKRYGLDVRGVRYPGIISSETLPGGGTTDYAVDIYHKAVQEEPFSCFLEKNTKLPMMYMDDAVKATIDLMNAPSEDISIRTSYNISAISFSPEEIAESIKKELPGFEISYQPDHRQNIAASWPNSIDDSSARKDWSWNPAYNLDEMTKEILENLPAFWDIEPV